MAITDSGQIGLIADVNDEINGNTTDTDVSLTTLSTGAGKSAPHGLTEFYSYSNAVAPSVNTPNATSVGTANITLNSNVTNDGGGTITERGFYFGTSTNRASNTKITVSGTTGGFSSVRSGLSSSTTYYFWAFATNSAGTTYTSMVTQATNQPSTSSLFTNFMTSGTNGPGPGSVPSLGMGNCATANLCWGAFISHSGYNKPSGATATMTWWLTSQTSNTVPTKSYSSMSNTYIYTGGNWCWGPSGNGGCGYRVESWAASGYSTYHIYRGTLCC